jgi:hypothetical protein
MPHGFIAAKKFFWNVDGKVGPASPNKIEDVQLVQLGYLCASVGQNTGIPAELKAVFGRVVPGAGYSGKSDDPLTVAIKAHQKFRGGTQDGVISVMHNASGIYDGVHSWMIASLNNNIKDVLGTNWPHLGRHPQCPAPLKAAALAVFP